MASAKQEVLRLLGELPEDVSYEEIQYHIYVVEKIRKAREAVQAGEVLSQEEVEKRTEKWLARCRGALAYPTPNPRTRTTECSSRRPPETAPRGKRPLR